MNNAIKYSPEGGTITCTMAIKGSQVVITVKDEGIGIPAEDLDHILIVSIAWIVHVHELWWNWLG